MRLVFGGSNWGCAHHFGGYLRFNEANKATYGDYAQQVVQTTPGATYTLTVTAGEVGSGSGNHDLLVEIIDQNGTVIGTSGVVTIANGATGQGIPVTYTATTPGTTIKITNTGSTNTVNSDLHIDQAINSLVATPSDPGAAGGDDSLSGGDGNDTILSGQGNDSRYGGTGNDDLRGELGNDSLFGGTDNDTLYGGAGNDSLNGGDGNDVLYGDDTAGTLSGNDSIQAGSGDDLIYGGQGTDTIYGDTSGDTVNGGSDTIYAGDGNESIFGGAGNDQLFGDAGTDSLFGGNGNDLLNGGAGVDSLTGGAGNDVFIADGTADRTSDFSLAKNADGNQQNNDFVDLSQFYNTVTLAAWNAANPGQTYATPLAWLRADQANGTLEQAGGLQIYNGGSAVAGSGLTFDNTNVHDTDGIVEGTQGSDHIDASYNQDPTGDVVDGNDAILPGAGPNDDSIRGYNGNDSIEAGLGNDSVERGHDNDTIHGGSGDDTLSGDGPSYVIPGTPATNSQLVSNATFASNMNGWTTSIDPGNIGQTVDLSHGGLGFGNYPHFNKPWAFTEVDPAAGSSLNIQFQYSEWDGAGQQIANSGTYTIFRLLTDPYDLNSAVPFTYLGNTVTQILLDGNSLTWQTYALSVANATGVPLYLRFDANTTGSYNPVIDNVQVNAAAPAIPPVTVNPIGDDLIYGEAGNDVINGDGGNDRLYGGTGNDILAQGAAADADRGAALPSRPSAGRLSGSMCRPRKAQWQGGFPRFGFG